MRYIRSNTLLNFLSILLTCQLGQGASPRELVVEACRRDQQHLIEQVLDSMSEKSNEEVAEFFNNVKDGMGNYALHICAMYGSCKYIRAFSQIRSSLLTMLCLAQTMLWTPSSISNTSNVTL